METCSLAEVLGRTGDVLPALGEYHILALDEQHPVAVSTLGSFELPDILAAKKPNGMCVVGKTETENIGIEKIIRNILAAPNIRYLLLCGEDSQGHLSGQTMLSLFENGVNERMRVVGSKGKRPILANTTPQAVAAFTNQTEIIDMIGCTDADKIIRKIEELAAQIPGQRRMPVQTPADAVPDIKVITAKPKDPQKVKLDRAGYFVIVPKAELGIILVEHYNYANQLLRVIQGDNARDIYWTIIENNWISEMSHAAYLGKELAAAQLSMQLGFKYIQDKA